MKIIRKSTLVNFVIPFLFLLLPICVFSDLVFQHKVPCCMDVLTQHYPFRAYASRMLEASQIPLWNPYTFSGIPFLANIQIAVFYPLNLILFTIFPLSTAFGLKLVLHFSIGGFFTYLYLRRINVTKISSIFSGIIFMFSGFILPKIFLPPILQASVLIPLLFYTFEIALEKKTIRCIFLAGVCLAIAIFSGYPHVVYGTLITLGIYALWRIPSIYIERRKELTGKKSQTIKIVNFLLLICLLIIISIALTGGGSFSIFGKKMGFHTLRNPLSAMLVLLVLKFVITIKRIKINWNNLAISLVLLTIIPALGVLLSAIQLLPSVELLRLSPQTGALFGQLTGYTNAQTLLKELAWGGLKHPEVSGFIGTFPLIFIVLAMFLKRKSEMANPYFSLFLFISFFVLLIVLECSLLVKILHYVPGFRLFPKLIRYLSIFVFSQSVLAGIALDNLAMRAKEFNLRLFQSATFTNAVKVFLLVVTTAQLLYQNSYIMKFVDPEQYYQPSRTVKYLKEDNLPFRIFAVDKQYSYFYERPEIVDLLIPNMGVYYGISDVQGYDPLQLKTYKHYISALNAGKKSPYPLNDMYHFAIVSPSDSNLINLLNVKYILSKEPIEGKNYKSIFKNAGVTIYLNTAFLPRAFMAYEYGLTSDIETSLSWIKDKVINIRKTVILNQKRFKGNKEILSFPHWWKDIENMSIKVESAGFGSGNYARIYVNGKQVAPNRRGYNIVIINPYTGLVERGISFDTCGSHNASKQMREFINNIPMGKIVAVAIKDDASNSLTEEAVLGLRNLGAMGDLLGRDRHFRWSHAVIGIKGLKPGQALESYRLGLTRVSLPFPVPVVYRIGNGEDDTARDSKIKIIKWSPHKITIKTDSKRDGFLVLSEIYYPGWKVYIDGRENKVLKANGIFRAVYLKRGQHLMQFIFSPFCFKLGLLISTLTFLLGIICSFFGHTWIKRIS